MNNERGLGQAKNTLQTQNSMFYLFVLQSTDTNKKNTHRATNCVLHAYVNSMENYS